MDFDTLIEKLGDFGRFQKYIFLYIAILAIPFAIAITESIFQAGASDFWCDIAGLQTHIKNNLTSTQIKIISGGYENLEEEQCQIINRPYASLSKDDVLDILNNDTQNGYNSSSCSSWYHDSEEIGKTVITDWNLVCDKRWMSAAGQSFTMLGMLVGVYFWGIIGDKYGRRPVCWIGLTGQLVSRIICAFSVNFPMYGFFKFLITFFAIGWFTSGYVIGVEYLSPKWRVLIGFTSQAAFVPGYIILTGVAYGLRHWVWTTLALSAFSLPYFVIQWLLPESARWLYANDRKDEADKIMKRVADINGKPLPQDYYITFQKDDANVTPLDLLKLPNLRRVTIVICCIWSLITLLYYGLTLNSGNLAGSVYVNFLLNGLVEFPGFIITAPLLNTRLGRRWSICLMLIIGGISLLLGTLVPKSLSPLLIFITLVGKMCSAAAFGVAYTYTPELFPTVLRNAGLGTASMFGRVAGITAPYVALLGQYNQVFPIVILGIAALVGAFLTLFLPETRGAALPQSIDEGEEQAKGSAFRRQKFKATKHEEKLNGEEMKSLQDTKAKDSSLQA